MAAVIIGGCLAIIVPVGVGAMTNLDFRNADPEHLLDLVLQHTVLLAWIVVIITIISIVAVAIHSFIEAATVATYVEGCRAAGGRTDRTAYARFTAEAWWNFGRRFWWRVFLIYNVVWAIFGLVILFPVMVLFILMMSIGDPSAALATGCLGAVVILLLLVVGGILVSIWSRFAIAECVLGDSVLRENLRRGWGVILARFGEVAFVVAIAFAAALGAVAVFGALYVIVGIANHVPLLAIVTIPIQIVLSVVQNVFSVLLSSWFSAAVVGIVCQAEGVVAHRG
ncbi:MAG: hypothetical protein ABI718_01710 [Acidobacteriota bacterium]